MSQNEAHLASALKGRRVLVVEDDYFIANDVRDWLADLGCDILGPFSAIDEPMDILQTDVPDAAVLDVNLAGKAVYPLAGKLLNRNVPILFVTGYAFEHINPQFRTVPRLMKPLGPRQLQHAVIDLLQPGQDPPRSLGGAFPSGSRSVS